MSTQAVKMSTVKTSTLIIPLCQEMEKVSIEKRELSSTQFSVMLYRSITTPLYHKLETRAWAPTDMG